MPGQGNLIIPIWKSSFFWGTCTKDGVHWSDFVIDWVYLPKFQGLFVKGKARNSLFGSRSLNFDVVALRIDFSRTRHPLSRRGYCTSPPTNVALVFRFCVPNWNCRMPWGFALIVPQINIVLFHPS